MLDAVRACFALLLLAAVPLCAASAGAAGFDSAEQAFDAVFIASGIGQRGYDENREYAAALYRMPDGRWYATPVIAGGRITSSIPYHLVPTEALQIAGAHTHGQPLLPEDPSHTYGTDFSQADRRNALQACRLTRGRIDSQLVLTSNLELLRMNIAMRYNPASSSIELQAQTSRLGRQVLATAGDPPARK